MSEKEGEKSPKLRGNKNTNKALLDHLDYDIMAVQKDDLIDRILKDRNFIIRKPTD